MCASTLGVNRRLSTAVWVSTGRQVDRESSTHRLGHPHFNLKGRGHRGESIEIRACARDLRSSADPESGSKGSDSPKSADSSLGAIYLGPRSIAFHSPTVPR